MANANVTTLITRQSVAAALAAARVEAAQHAAWMNAINRAALNLEACIWQFDGDILVIHSATSAARYTVDAHGCQCKAHDAGRPCWHRAARRLLVKAAEMAAPQVTRPRRSPAELQAAADALFA
jgi:hypothetical protein